ncbi:MAG: hypothetical protein V3V96_14230, partial [Acidiferrobacterales bacterium]
MRKESKPNELRVSDQASLQVLTKAAAEGIETCFTRTDAQGKRCVFGTDGVCCRICYMGPCT